MSQPQLVPILQQYAPFLFPWDKSAGEVRTRLEYLQDFEEYYDGTIFKRRAGDFLLEFVLADHAQANVFRALYNAAPDVVNFFKTNVLRGVLVRPEKVTEQFRALVEGTEEADNDQERLATIRADNERVIDPIIRTWEWSRFDVKRELAVQWAATMGDAVGIVVEDARLAGGQLQNGSKVYIELCHPAKLVDWAVDARDNFTYVRVEEIITERDPRKALSEKGFRTYKKTRIWTKTKIMTLKDDKPWDYRTDDGSGQPTFDNPHGFVPVKLIQHQHADGTFGVPAFVDIIDLINEACVRASHIGDLIGEHTAPLWAILGASGGDIDRSQSNLLYIPEGKDVRALVAELRVLEAYGHITKLTEQMAKKHPEIEIGEIRRRSGDVTGQAVRNLMMDLMQTAERIQENYGIALRDLMQMAMTMGSNLAGTGRSVWRLYGMPDPGVYENGDLDFRWRWAPIFSLTKLELLQALAQANQFRQELAAQKAGSSAQVAAQNRQQGGN